MNKSNTRSCPRCGDHNKFDAIYCRRCGIAFPLTTEIIEANSVNKNRVSSPRKFVIVGLIASPFFLATVIGMFTPDQRRNGEFSAAIPSSLMRVAPTPTPILLPPEALRNELADSYRRFISTKELNMNFIGTKIVRQGKSGYALYATHEYFSQYSFSLGSLAGEVQSWIAQNRSDLVRARITRVGVMDRGEYASWAWFDVD
jgi:hypothetical protein